MIADALFSLMKRKPFQQITVTEICEEAAIGRKTFYRNFDLREDVIDFQLDLLCAEYEKEMMTIPLEKRLCQHFAFVQKNMDYFVIMYRSGLISQLHEKFAVFLPDTMPVWTKDPVEQEYRSQYIIAGIEAIQRVWVERGFKETLEEVVTMAQRAHDRQIPIL